MPPEFDDTEIFATTARIIPATSRATPAELQARLADVALDPSVFDDAPPFFWLAAISSDQLDAYSTRMDAATTLPNFAREAAAGVAFLEAHNHWTVPFGRSLSGQLEAGDATRVTADFYTVPALPLGSGRTTDDFIRRVRTGIQQDVSVGFYGGRFICDICGNDVRDWRACTHYPGLMYDVTGADGVVRQVRATALVVDAHLSEVSAVYDGATPGAVILKAQRAAEAGAIEPKTARLLEARYRLALPDRRLQVTGAALPQGATAMSKGATGGATDPERDAPATPAEPTPEPTALATTERAGDPVTTIVDPLAPIRVALALDAESERDAVLAAIRALQQERDALQADAADGRQYRTDLVSEALAEGVRALGSAFETETYRTMLTAAPLKTIKRMRDDWRVVGDARLPGGRATVDDDEPEAEPARGRRVPDAAFTG